MHSTVRGWAWAKRVLSKGRGAFRLKALENYCGGKAFIRTWSKLYFLADRAIRRRWQTGGEGVNDGLWGETLRFRLGLSKLYRLCVEGKSLLRVRHETLYAVRPNRMSQPTFGGLDSVCVSLTLWFISYYDIPRYNSVTTSVRRDELRGDGKSTQLTAANNNIICSYYIIHYTSIKYNTIMYATRRDE